MKTGVYAHPGLDRWRQSWFARLGYKPHNPGQRNFHQSTARFRALFAGSRFGKSIAGAREIEVLILAAPDLFGRPIRA